MNNKLQRFYCFLISVLTSEASSFIIVVHHKVCRLVHRWGMMMSALLRRIYSLLRHDASYHCSLFTLSEGNRNIDTAAFAFDLSTANTWVGHAVHTKVGSKLFLIMLISSYLIYVLIYTLYNVQLWSKCMRIMCTNM